MPCHTTPCKELGIDDSHGQAGITTALLALGDQTIGCVLPLEDLPVWQHSLKRSLEAEPELTRYRYRYQCNAM